MVILDACEVSVSFEEKLKNKIQVRESIYDLSKKMPIDLIVYTRAEYDILSKNKSSIIFFATSKNLKIVCYLSHRNVLIS